MDDWIWIFLIIIVILSILSALFNRRREPMINLSSLGNFGGLGNLNLGNLDLRNLNGVKQICNPLYQPEGTTCAVLGQGNLLDAVGNTKCYNAYVNENYPEGRAAYLGEASQEACSNVSNLCSIYGSACNAPNLNNL